MKKEMRIMIIILCIGAGISAIPLTCVFSTTHFVNGSDARAYNYNTPNAYTNTYKSFYDNHDINLVFRIPSGISYVDFYAIPQLDEDIAKSFGITHAQVTCTNGTHRVFYGDVTGYDGNAMIFYGKINVDAGFRWYEAYLINKATLDTCKAYVLANIAD